MKITAKEISDYVDQHQSEALDFLKEIIQTPSVTGDEEAVSFVFEKWMKKIEAPADESSAQSQAPCSPASKAL